MTNAKTGTVVYLHGDHCELYSISSTPDTLEARPSNLIFKKLLWWFDVHITLRMHPEVCLCLPDAWRWIWGCQVSYYPAKQGLVDDTSHSEASFASKEEMIFVWGSHGMGVVLSY